MTLQASLEKNCTKCSNLIKCDDPKRGGPDHVCSKFAGWASDEFIANLVGDKTISEKDLIRAMGTNELAASGILDSMREQEAAYEEETLRLIDSMKASGSGGRIMVDDSAAPLAPNFWEFASNRNGLNYTLRPMQVIIGLNSFSEWCPICSKKPEILWDAENMDLVSYDLDRLNHPKDKDIVLTRFGVCPECGITRQQLYQAGHINNHTRTVVIAGQRAGKTTATVAYLSYQLHRFLKIGNLSNIYGPRIIARNSPLAMTLVAQTYSTAVSLLLWPLMDLIEDAPWFQLYHSILEKHKERTDVEVYSKFKTAIQYKHRNIIVNALNPSRRVLRGATRIGGAIDEFGYMPFSEEGEKTLERADADETLTSLHNSMLTVRSAQWNAMTGNYDHVDGYTASKLPTAMLFLLGSPLVVNDRLMKARREGINSKLVYSIQQATWEMNPEHPKDDPEIVADFARDPVKAMRDWAGIPPHATNAFIKDMTLIKDHFGPLRNVLWDYSYVDTKYKGLEQKRRHAKFMSLGHNRGPCTLAIDMAEVHDSFALSLARLKNDENNTPQIIGKLEIMPEGRVLDFGMIYEHIIKPIIENFNVVKVYTDQYQSKMIMDHIHKDTLDPATGQPRTLCKKYSLKHNERQSDFKIVKEFLQDIREHPEFPAIESEFVELINTAAIVDGEYPSCFKYGPVAHSFWQMMSIQDTGRTVEHAPGFHDDLVRADFLNLAMLYDPDEAAWLLEQEEKVFVEESGARDKLFASSYDPAIRSSVSAGLRRFQSGAVANGRTASKATAPRLASSSKVLGQRVRVYLGNPNQKGQPRDEHTAPITNRKRIRRKQQYRRAA